MCADYPQYPHLIKSQFPKNFKWVVQADGRGGATIRSLMFPYYVKYGELRLDSELALDSSPFTWEMIKDREGFRSVLFRSWHIFDSNAPPVVGLLFLGPTLR